MPSVVRVLLPTSLLLAAGIAHAGRTVDEPPTVKRVLKSASAKDVSAALSAAGLEKQCNPTTLGSSELLGVSCRLAVFAHQARKLSPTTAKDVAARLDMAKAAAAAAESISTFEPLSKPPNLAEARFSAHKQACAAVRDAWDAVRSVPKSGAPELVASATQGLEAPLLKDKKLRDLACDCTGTGLSLAQSAGASLEESGALQGAMTSRGCGLDQSKIRAERGGPKASFSGEAKKVASENTDEAQLLAYAKTRDIGLDRCREKLSVGARLVDAKKTESCVCGEVKRWAFPKKKGRADVTIVVPVRQDQLGVRLTVTAPGKVTACGPLEGPLATP